MIHDLILLFGVWPWYRLSVECDSRGLALLVYASQTRDGPFVPIQRLPTGTTLHMDDKDYKLDFDNSCDFSPLDEPISIAMLWDNITLQLDPRDRTIETLVDLFDVTHTDDMVSTLDAICGRIPSLQMELDTNNPGEFHELLRRQPYQHPFSIYARSVGEELLKTKGIKRPRAVHFCDPPHPGVKLHHPTCDCWAGVWMMPDGSYCVQGHSVPEPAGPFQEPEAMSHFRALLRVMCDGESKSSAHKDLHRRVVGQTHGGLADQPDSYGRANYLFPYHQDKPGTRVDRTKGYSITWQEDAAHFIRCLAEETHLSLQAHSGQTAVAMVYEDLFVKLIKGQLDNEFVLQRSWCPLNDKANYVSKALELFKDFCREAVRKIDDDRNWAWYERLPRIAQRLGLEYGLAVVSTPSGSEVVAQCEEQWVKVVFLGQEEGWSITLPQGVPDYAEGEEELMHKFELCFSDALVRVLNRVEGELAHKVRDIACELEDSLHLQIFIDRSPGKYRLSSDVRGERRWCEIHRIKHDLYAVLPDYQTTRIEWKERQDALFSLKTIAANIFSNPNCTPKNAHHNRNGDAFPKEPDWVSRFRRVANEMANEKDLPLMVRRIGERRLRILRHRANNPPQWVEIERGSPYRDEKWEVTGYNAKPTLHSGEPEATSAVIRFIRQVFK